MVINFSHCLSYAFLQQLIQTVHIGFPLMLIRSYSAAFFSGQPGYSCAKRIAGTDVGTQGKETSGKEAKDSEG